MNYALKDSKIVEANVTAPKRATCPICGEWVELSTAPDVKRPMYFHLTGTDAIVCERLRNPGQPREAR